MTERCYNCGKEERITKGISSIEKVEVDYDDCLDELEQFIPLCSDCAEKVVNGEWVALQKRWKAEEDKEYYSSLEKSFLECCECGKELIIGVPYYSVCVNKEKESPEIEVLEAEVLFTYCENCFKKVEVVMKKRT